MVTKLKCCIFLFFTCVMAIALAENNGQETPNIANNANNRDKKSSDSRHKSDSRDKSDNRDRKSDSRGDRDKKSDSRGDRDKKSDSKSSDGKDRQSQGSVSAGTDRWDKLDSRERKYWKGPGTTRDDSRRERDSTERGDRSLFKSDRGSRRSGSDSRSRDSDSDKSKSLDWSWEGSDNKDKRDRSDGSRRSRDRSDGSRRSRGRSDGSRENSDSRSLDAFDWSRSREDSNSDGSRAHGDDRRRSRSDSRDKSRSDSRDKSHGSHKSDSRDKSRNDSRDKSRNDSRDKSRKDSRDKSKKDSRDRSKSDSRDRSKSGSYASRGWSRSASGSNERSRSKNYVKNEQALRSNLTISSGLFAMPPRKKTTIQVWVALRSFSAVDKLENTMTGNMWIYLRYYDWRLRWDPRNHGHIRVIETPLSDIWTPPINVLNSANGESSRFDEYGGFDAVVHHTGRVEILTYMKSATICLIRVLNETLPRQQSCGVKLGLFPINDHRIIIRAKQPRKLYLASRGASNCYRIEKTTVEGAKPPTSVTFWYFFRVNPQHPMCNAADLKLPIRAQVPRLRKAPFINGDSRGKK